MPQKTFYFFAPISNISGPANLLVFDKSIQPVKWSAKKIINLLAELQDTENSFDADYKINTSECLNAAKTHGWVIHFSIDLPIQSGVDYIHDTNITTIIEAFNTNIENKLKLLRLFTGGSARVMGPYWYVQYPNNRALIFETVRQDVGIGKKTQIKKRLTADINNFINSTILPLKPDYINLALDSYNLSQEIHPLSLRFLSLMISLETLFNDNPQELSYRITRNVSILLGNTIAQSQDIAKKIKELYGKRSKLVHNGKTKEIINEDIDYLEDIVRQSILLLYKSGKSKNELAEIFTTMGFGSWKA